VQRHRKHRQETEAQASDPRPLPEIKRIEPGATQEHRRGRRDDRFHGNAERKQQGAE